MMGRDAAMGYPVSIKKAAKQEECVHEDTEEEKGFEERKKKALESIGRGDGTKKEQEEKKDPRIEDLQMKVNSVQHDITMMRAQVNEAVNVLNKLQIGFVSKLGELQGKMDAKFEQVIEIMNKKKE